MFLERLLFSTVVGCVLLFLLLLVRRTRQRELRGPASVGPSLLTGGLGVVGGTAVAVLIATTVYSVFFGPDSSSNAGATESFLPPQVRSGGFVTSKSCRSCHPGYYNSWHDSFHRTMTQPASPQTVVVPFDETHLENFGEAADLERRGDQFWVTVYKTKKAGTGVSANASAQVIDRRNSGQIVMTTGSHHFQVYWIRGPNGQLVQFPWRYHLKEKRWMHRKNVFMHPPGKPFYEDSPVWNANCINCHSVGGQPRHELILHPTNPTLYRFEINDTQVAEFGISCEACHGPGEEHVRANSNPLRRYKLHLDDDKPDPTIINPARLSPERASEICGYCHSHNTDRSKTNIIRRIINRHRDPHFQRDLKESWWVKGSKFRAGDELEKFVDLVKPEDEIHETFKRYWADGTSRSGGREFMGTIQSECYKSGDLSCLSCHSMHESDPNDQLADKMHTNEACLECHSKMRDRLEEHTHHAPSSSGSLCYNCHMPHTSYALMTSIRNHKIDKPRVTRMVPDGRPNACNLCHLDQTLSWTAKHLTDWYDAPEVELDDDEKNIAASILWLLRGNSGQRAVLAWHMGWDAAKQASGDDWIAPHLAELLDDPYPVVRHLAYGSLRKIPGFAEFKFDFEADPDKLLAAQKRALERWLSSEIKAPPSTKPHVLIDDQKKRRLDVIERLLQQRDDTPLGIIE